MGILSITPETYNVPDWVLKHPGLECQLSRIETANFHIYYGLQTEGGMRVFNKLFSVDNIPGIEVTNRYAINQYIHDNMDRIADHIIETLKKLTRTNEIYFVSNVHFGSR